MSVRLLSFYLGGKGPTLVRIFGQNCTHFKENYCILWKDIMPKMIIHRFFIKRIIWMFLKLIFIKNIRLGVLVLKWVSYNNKTSLVHFEVYYFNCWHFLITSIFKPCTVLHLFPLVYQLWIQNKNQTFF